MAYSLGAENMSHSSEEESSSEMAPLKAELNEGEVGQLIEKRISKIYKRLKDTDANLNAMEKLMSEGDRRKPGRRTPAVPDRCSHSMTDLHAPQIQQTHDTFLHHKICQLENQQAKLQSSVEELNRSVQSSKSPIYESENRASMEQVSRQLQQISWELGNTKTSFADREKEIKLKAKNSVHSWKNKCRNLYVEKQHLEEQLTKSKGENEMIMREQEMLRLQVDDIYQQVKRDTGFKGELQLKLNECREASTKKDEILQKYQRLYEEAKNEVVTQKAELEQQAKTNQIIKVQNENLLKLKLELEEKLKGEEKRNSRNDTKILSAEEKIKELEKLKQQLKEEIFHLQKNTSEKNDSISEELKVQLKSFQGEIKRLKEENKCQVSKNEKAAGEIECLKNELQELKSKYDRLLKDYYAKTEETFSKDRRLTRLENSLKDSYKSLSYKEQDFRIMLTSITCEIDKLLNVWNSVSDNSIPVQGLVSPAFPVSSHPKIHLVDIQSKLKLLQEEFSSRRNKSVPQQQPPNDLQKTFFSHLQTNSAFNLDLPKKNKKKVNSTKINKNKPMSSISENNCSRNLFNNSSLSSINKSVESSEEASTS